MRVLFRTRLIRAAAEPFPDDGDEPGNRRMRDVQVNLVPHILKVRYHFV